MKDFKTFMKGVAIGMFMPWMISKVMKDTVNIIIVESKKN